MDAILPVAWPLPCVGLRSNRGAKTNTRLHQVHGYVPWTLLPNPGWPRVGWHAGQLSRRVAEMAWADVGASQKPSKADGFSDSLSSIGKHEVNVTLHKDKHVYIGIYFLGTFNLQVRNFKYTEKLQE